jgi:hypothetical protein
VKKAFAPAYDWGPQEQMDEWKAMNALDGFSMLDDSLAGKQPTINYGFEFGQKKE